MFEIKGEQKPFYDITDIDAVDNWNAYALSDLLRIQKARAFDVTVEPMDPGSAFIVGCIADIKTHSDVICIISGKSQAEVPTLFDAFVKKEFFYTFSSETRGIVSFLRGLSSFDGSRTYIKKLNNYAEESKKVLCHELMHNFPRWLNAQNGVPDHLLISPSKNRNLRIRGIPAEAGDVFEFLAYHKEVTDVSPFCLNTIDVPKVM
jgi:hypothetical protein